MEKEKEIKENIIKYKEKSLFLIKKEESLIMPIAKEVNISSDIIDWAINIANNYNSDLDTNILSQVIDAARDLKLDINAINKRWQNISIGNYVETEDIVYLLVGM